MHRQAINMPILLPAMLLSATLIVTSALPSRLPLRPLKEILRPDQLINVDSRFSFCHACMPTECGRVRSPTGILPRIYGGTAAPRGRHPWIAIVSDAQNNLIGSGVLISCNLALTTAFNVQKVPHPSLLRIRLGAANVNERQDGELEFQVKQVFLHPEWNPQQSLHANDIAVLQLDGSVDFEQTNGYIAPICLPAEDRNYTGWLTVAGFGQNLYGTNQGELRETDIFQLPKKDCAMFFDQPYTFCGLGNNKGLCNGDRGSPAVQAESDGRFSLAALANDFQCWAGGSDVYTATSHFVNWICSVSVLP